MIKFINDAELFRFLLNGGTVIEIRGPDRKEIRLVNGIKTYTKTNERAKNCLLSYEWWLGKENN